MLHYSCHIRKRGFFLGGGGGGESNFPLNDFLRFIVPYHAAKLDKKSFTQIVRYKLL